MNKKKNGFTLIELLAVIIILGILMIIAIPSVTKYINDSRKSSYIDTAKELVAGARNLVNKGDLGMYSTDTTYYIPSSCIKVENGDEAESPYGKFIAAYIGIIYNGQGYKYYWISVDDSGQGIKNITPLEKLETDLIESDLKKSDVEDTVKATGIGQRSEIYILDCKKESWETQIHLDDTSNNASEENGGSSGGGTTSTAASEILLTAQTAGQLNRIEETNIYIFKGGTANPPANYVKFNNEDWRIIGIYGNQLKIIRVDSNGVPTAPTGFTSVVYNSLTPNPGWANSSLKESLNTTYYNTLSNEAKNMIDENGLWNVGSADYTDSAVYSAYNNEIKLTDIGKVGLLASYEFLYASSGNRCETKSGQYGYFNLECGTEVNDWLNPRNSSGSWLLSPYSNNSDNALVFYSSGTVGHSYVSNTSYDCIPAVFLKSRVKIVSGDGQSPSTAYVLK